MLLPDAADKSHVTASQDSLGALVCPGALRPSLRRFRSPAPFGYAGRTPSSGGDAAHSNLARNDGDKYFCLQWGEACGPAGDEIAKYLYLL